jgi:NADPH:quinone reductase-like Zn-dependent oxidoreductase
VASLKVRAQSAEGQCQGRQLFRGDGSAELARDVPVRRGQRPGREEAGALFVAGTTAYAAVRAVGLTGGDTEAVSGAAGGVGSIAVQLARHAGAIVNGTARHYLVVAGRKPADS